MKEIPRKSDIFLKEKGVKKAEKRVYDMGNDRLSKKAGRSLIPGATTKG